MEEKILFQKDNSIALNKNWEEISESSKSVEFEKIQNSFNAQEIKQITGDIINDKEGMIRVYNFIAKDYKKIVYVFVSDKESEEYVRAFEEMRIELVKQRKTPLAVKWIDNSIDKVLEKGVKLTNFIDKHNKFKNTMLGIGLAATLAVGGVMTTQDIKEAPEKEELAPIVNEQVLEQELRETQNEKTEEELLEEYLAQTGLLNLEEIQSESHSRGL